MNTILPVLSQTINGEEKQAVSVRQLVEAIGIETPTTMWFQRQIEKYGFVENEDFLTVLLESSGGRPSTDYVVPLDIAKELCMIANTEKGRQVRKYFIEMEKKATKYYLPKTYSEALKLLAEEVEAKELALKQLESTNDTLKIFHKANEAILNRNDDVIACKAKEFKTVHAKLKSDIGVEINEIVYQIFLPKGDENYSEAHRQSKQKFFIETGIQYMGAKKTSLDTKKQYLRWLQSQV